MLNRNAHRLALMTVVYCLLGVSYGHAQEKPIIKIGIPTVLSGDFAILGHNVVATAETYKKHYARHNLQFSYEDAKISSMDGLRAYQKLINVDNVDIIVGACSSNCTMASKALINNSKTPTITIVTGGAGIDKAGPFIFRVGNSDTLNGEQEAEHFLTQGITQVALLTEETEYTQNISEAFRRAFTKRGGTLVYDQNFLPGTIDFRSEVSLIKKSNPGGILMPTQTGTALGMFVKQWREQAGASATPIHTSFVAAPNPDAYKTAGEAIYGVYYMAPQYDRESARWKEFFEKYRGDHSKDPPIAFHSAGTVDALDMLQAYLDKHETFDKEKFATFLLEHVKDYQGLMGRYSFDADGNANLGFRMAQITKENAGRMD